MKLLNEILGTKYPLLQGGLANIATGEFAAACSNAGALGLIGSGGMDAEADVYKRQPLYIAPRKSQFSRVGGFLPPLSR